jgi:hypothetical protein
MRVGTLEDEHKEVVEEMEEIFNKMKELTMTHVHFRLHSAQSSA